MRRVIAVMACGFMLAACSTTMPSLDFMKSAPQAESLAIESEPAGAEAKTSLGQSCRTPCQLSVQPGSEFSVTLALSGYQPQTVSVRPEARGATAEGHPDCSFSTLDKCRARVRHRGGGNCYRSH